MAFELQRWMKAAFTPKLPFTIKRMLTILFLLLCYYCEVFVMSTTCDADHVAIKQSPNDTICLLCPNCPESYGLAVKCGSTIENAALLKCIPCVAGMNYSSSHDHTMCKPCRHSCDLYQNRTGQCTLDKYETVCDKCISGYYMEEPGICKKCTWCCKGKNSSRRMQECIQAGLPENKQCAEDGSSESCAPPTTSTTPGGTQTNNDGAKGMPVKKKIAIAVGVIFFLMVLILILVFVAYKCGNCTRLSFCTKFFQWSTDDHEQRTSNGSYKNMAGRRRYVFQPSWPFTTRLNNQPFNPEHLSTVQDKNVTSANPTVSLAIPAAEKPDGMNKDGPEVARPHHYSTVNSFPGYPITSNNLFGPPGNLFQKMHERIKNKSGFGKFENEEDGGGSSGSGPQDPLQVYLPNKDCSSEHGMTDRTARSGLRLPNGDCSSEHGMTDRTARSGLRLPNGDCSSEHGMADRTARSGHRFPNGDCSSEHGMTDRTARSGLRLPNGDCSSEHGMTDRTARSGLSNSKPCVTVVQPGASSAGTNSTHSRNRTDLIKDPKVKKALQEIRSNESYSPERLNKKASEIPYQVLGELCPKMNVRRDFDFLDYRMMGQLMGFDNNVIEAAQTVSNATEYLLKRYDSSYRGTIGHVMAVLTSIPRDDAFRVLEKYCLESVEAQGSEMLQFDIYV